MLPVDVIAATAVAAVEGTVGIGIKAGMVVEAVAITVEEEEEEEDDVKMDVAKVEVVTVAVVVGMVGKDVEVTEEDEGSTRLNRKPETIAAVDVTVVVVGIDGDTVIADGGADVRTDDGADVRADGAVVIGAVAIVGKTAAVKAGVADTDATSLPWLAGARPNKVKVGESGSMSISEIHTFIERIVCSVSSRAFPRNVSRDVCRLI